MKKSVTAQLVTRIDELSVYRVLCVFGSKVSSVTEQLKITACSVEMKLLHLCCTDCFKASVVLQVAQPNTQSIVSSNGCDCATNHLLIYD